MPLNIHGPLQAKPPASAAIAPSANAAVAQAGSTPSQANAGLPANLRALPNAIGGQAVSGDFGQTATSAGSSLLALAGVQPAPPVALPHPIAEQYVRGALEMTLNKIEEMAGALLAECKELLAGPPSGQSELMRRIGNFLQLAEKTMVDMVGKMSCTLEAPPSPGLHKLLNLLGNDLWRDLEAMQKDMQQAFSGLDSAPDASTRTKITDSFVTRQARQFQARIDAIQLPAAVRPGFDVSKITSIAAMHQEVLAVARLARAARNTPGAAVSAEPTAAFVHPEPGVATDEPDEPDELDESNEIDDAEPHPDTAPWGNADLLGESPGGKASRDGSA